MLKSWLARIGGVLAIVFALIQGYRPERTNPPVDPSRTIQSVMSVPGPVNEILQRSCNDCHSNDTHWPWYSNVAPMSWLVVKDVNDGRAQMNFSNWAAYDRRDAAHALEEICEETEKGEMPLKAYLLTHPRARLSKADIHTLCAWTEQFDDRRGRNRGRR